MSLQEKITARRVILCLVFALVLVGVARLPSRGASVPTILATTDRDTTSWCPVPDAATAPDDGLTDSASLIQGDEVLTLQVSRLAAAVNISTVSYDDMGDVDIDPRWHTFDELHDRLEVLFPLVHRYLVLQKINKYGLLYHLPGSNKMLRPVLFMAHQDVVPASDADTWRYPPFEAHFDGQWLWGRGAADCKSNLIAILSAMEALLDQAFKPERTIILSLGFDEETGGFRGAAHLARYLEEKLGPGGLATIHDEGGMGVTKLGRVAYAMPATAEKGFMDVVLSLETNGGHSSRPPSRTAIGIMSQMILALEEHPFSPTLDGENPVRGVLECQAKYSPEHVEPWLRAELASGRDISKRIAESRGDKIRWQIQTSQAVDIIRGGVQDNQLPEEVTVVANYRVLPHDHVDRILSDIATLLAPIAHEHGLAVSGFGLHENRTTQGVLSLEAKGVLLPSPITPTSTDSTAWNIFASTLRQVFETSPTLSDVDFVVPVGSIATGNSDTAHYWNLTRNIFRFTPALEGSRSGVHTVNERIEMNAHLDAIRVYYELMRNFQFHEGDTCAGLCPAL